MELATPLANEVVRAEHDGPVLAATPTLTSGPTGVHVHGHGTDERFASTHFPDDEAGATAVHHLHGGSADVLLGGKRLAEVILKARKWVAVGDVKWSQGTGSPCDPGSLHRIGGSRPWS